MLENIFHINIIAFLATGSYLALACVVFIESGFFLFLPGDSLLFAAGLLGSNGALSITTVIIVTILASVSGYASSYWIGRALGQRLFTKENAVLFNKQYLKETEDFYNRYGSWTVVLARFIPFVRTIAPILAGAGKMHYPSFLVYSLLGSVLWGAGIPLLGYYLGTSFPWLGDHLTEISLVIIVVSIVPVAIAFARSRKKPKGNS